MPKVTLSRFFDENARLVAGVCSRCFLEGDDDVRIVAVNRKFLEQVERRRARATDHCQTDSENGDLKLSTITADECPPITLNPSPVPQIMPPPNDSNNNASLCIAGNFQEPARRNFDSFQNADVKTETLLVKHELPYLEEIRHGLHFKTASREFGSPKTKECSLEDNQPGQRFDSIKVEPSKTNECNLENDPHNQHFHAVEVEHLPVESEPLKAKKCNLDKIRSCQSFDPTKSKLLLVEPASRNAEKRNFDDLCLGQSFEAFEPPKTKEYSLEDNQPGQRFDSIKVEASKTIECILENHPHNQLFHGVEAEHLSVKSEPLKATKCNFNKIRSCRSVDPTKRKLLFVEPASRNAEKRNADNLRLGKSFEAAATIEFGPPKTKECSLEDNQPGQRFDSHKVEPSKTNECNLENHPHNQLFHGVEAEHLSVKSEPLKAKKCNFNKIRSCRSVDPTKSKLLFVEPGSRNAEKRNFDNLRVGQSFEAAATLEFGPPKTKECSLEDNHPVQRFDSTELEHFSLEFELYKTKECDLRKIRPSQGLDLMETAACISSKSESTDTENYNLNKTRCDQSFGAVKTELPSLESQTLKTKECVLEKVRPSQGLDLMETESLSSKSESIATEKHNLNKIRCDKYFDAVKTQLPSLELQTLKTKECVLEKVRPSQGLDLMETESISSKSESIDAEKYNLNKTLCDKCFGAVKTQLPSLVLQTLKTKERDLKKVRPSEVLDLMETESISSKPESIDAEKYNLNKALCDKCFGAVKTQLPSLELQTLKTKECDLEKVHPSQGRDLMETESIFSKSESINAEKYNLNKTLCDKCFGAVKPQLLSLELQTPKECDLEKVRPSQGLNLMETESISSKSESIDAEKYNLNKALCDECFGAGKTELPSLESQTLKAKECVLEKVRPSQGLDLMETESISSKSESIDAEKYNLNKTLCDKCFGVVKTELPSLEPQTLKTKECDLENVRPSQGLDLMETESISSNPESIDAEKYNLNKTRCDKCFGAVKTQLPSLELQTLKTKECALDKVCPTQGQDLMETKYIPLKSEPATTDKPNLNKIRSCQDFTPQETKTEPLKTEKCSLEPTHLALKSEKCNLAKLRGHHAVKTEKPPRQPLWTPPRSPHNLIEESLFRDPWALLVATIFLNKTSCKSARPRVEEFLRDFAGPSDVLAKPPSDLEKYFLDLGLFKRRAEQVWRMSHDYVHKDWRSAKELYGIGKYGEDAYRIFVLGDLDVEPTDRFLRIYRDWVRMGKSSATRDCSSGDDD